MRKVQAMDIVKNTPMEACSAVRYMLQIISRYWINFTKTGNPNSDGLPFWTSYQQDKPTMMIMKEDFHLAPVQNQKQMDFFEEFFQAKRMGR